jgi:predicted nucleic acid-binding protein
MHGIVYNTIMRLIKVVLDTNVLIAALRSRRGASFRLLEHIDSAQLEFYLSVPLFLEYESVAKRLIGQSDLMSEDIDAVLTFNKRDFKGAEQFGLRVLSPQALLKEIGVEL